MGSSSGALAPNLSLPSVTLRGALLSHCNKCGTTKPAGDFYPDRTKAKGHHSVCKECVKAQRRRRWAEDPEPMKRSHQAYYQRNKGKFLAYARKVREEVLAAYGGRCACCGETTSEFLTIDHVNNDGAAHRREIGGYGLSIYRWLRREGFPQDGRFQILCHNCNQAKGLYGTCPHQRS